jgi:hypothetical protein
MMQKTRLATLAGALAGATLLSIATVSASPLASVASVDTLVAGSAHLSDVVEVQGGRRGNRAGRGGGGARVGGRGGGRGGRGRGGSAVGAAAAVGIFGAVVGAMAADAARKEAIRDCRRTYVRRYDAETGMVYIRGDSFPCP